MSLPLAKREPDLLEETIETRTSTLISLSTSSTFQDSASLTYLFPGLMAGYLFNAAL